jgi:hypothetical protein
VPWTVTVVPGNTDSDGKDHYWHLSYNLDAEKCMMQTVISALKTRTFPKGIEYR